MPDTDAIEACPRDLVLDDKWDTSQLRRLIDARCEAGRKPTHLFLGHKESALLRRHLGEAFGEEAVSRLEHLWYMGLRVFELDVDSFARVAGDKFMKDIDNDPTNLQKLQEEELGRWRLSLG